MEIVGGVVLLATMTTNEVVILVVPLVAVIVTVAVPSAVPGVT